MAHRCARPAEVKTYSAEELGGGRHSVNEHDADDDEQEHEDDGQQTRGPFFLRIHSARTTAALDLCLAGAAAAPRDLLEALLSVVNGELNICTAGQTTLDVEGFPIIVSFSQQV
ncbi:hypothetical protein SeLEV6574_g01632 [Synchytrium endobioticum]|uniref:Uncharacterized protein n=1 Tax=Synchytrium endobioticum TaxID=286115 RepID=A0A507DCL5_9FUNG|nr:hypothetical protein SeLEV6574_g01632 [Synchytrium endobioticum]